MSSSCYRALIVAVCLVFWTSPLLCAQVKFAVDLTWELGAPDGQTRYMILVNGQFPGPQLTLDQGDDVEVG